MRLPRRVLALAASVVLVTMPRTAIGQEVEAAAAGRTFTFRTSIKASALLSRAPDAPELFPERVSAQSMWRIRVEPEVKVGGSAAFAVAYEQRLRYSSNAGGLTSVTILPAQSAAPFRIRALDWPLSESSAASWRHEIDRATFRFRAADAEVTIGRQAIGWGRGVMFGAVDLFAPFSPLEADREWRRGVDAVRADIKLTERSSADVVAAFGRDWDSSALAARVRGYVRSLDVEAMAGRRARDVFGGVATSAPIGDAALHGELAVFRVPAGDLDIDARTVWKAVVGGSYRFPIGTGILAYAEYHYSGFGAPRAEDILQRLSSPRFAERYIRGDTQILSRHAAAITASYEASPEYSLSAQLIHNPRDRSGVVAPGLTLTLSDQLSLLGAVYVPYGRGPANGVPRSEYGTAPLSGLLQLRLYL